MAASLNPPPAVTTPSGPHNGATRPAAIGVRGMVCSANQLASLAGLRILLEGGNAVDAAVAVATTLAVVEPFMSGPGGGGGYMTIYEAATGSVTGLDYMGWAPRATRAETWTDQQDVSGDVRAACVPGIVAGWTAALERFGRMDRASVFKHAIAQAEQGWPVTEFGAAQLRSQQKRLERFESSRAVFYPNGRPPRARELVKQPDLARSFREIADGGADAFYRGPLGARFARAIQEAGGWLTGEDLADFKVRWRNVLAVDYRGDRVATLPPSCSGVQYLEALKMLEAHDLPSLGHNSTEYLHLLIEVCKLASADRAAFTMREDVDIESLLTSEFAADRRALVDMACARSSEGERYQASKTGLIPPGDPRRYAKDHTTHFEVADSDGNLVSVTQSNGGSWGCGFVAGDTGITLNNFLYWQDISPESPNYLQPGVTMECPMAPCIVTRDGKPILGIGTPGSYGILQTTLQMILNHLAFGMNIQAAIEAPRFRAFEGTNVDIESRVPGGVLDGLRARGHNLNVLPDFSMAVGGGHGIAIDPKTGVYTGGADPRRDGMAIGY